MTFYAKKSFSCEEQGEEGKKGMGRIKSDNREKYELLRSAALDLFYEQGIGRTTVAQIAARAGVAKGTFYLYFPTKERLVEELFLYCLQRSVAACAEGLEAEPTACGKLRRRILNMLRWHRRHPREAWMQRALNLPPSMQRENYELMSPHYLAERAIIQEGIKSGEFCSAPADLLCEMFFSAVGGIIRYVNLHPEVMEDPAALSLALDTMLRGIVRQGG